MEASDDALFAIARLANGGMRDSQSILDQVISFCGKKISEKDVLDIYGLASKEQIEGLAAALAAADYAAVVRYADAFVEEGRDLLRWLLQAGLCFTAACPGPGTPAGQIYWEEGRRHVGVAVLRLLQEADPSHLPRLFLTQEEDDARN